MQISMCKLACGTMNGLIVILKTFFLGFALAQADVH